MTFLEFPIKRYQFTIVAFLLLVALGLSSWRSIPRQEDPYFPLSVFVITAVYPGAEPLDVDVGEGGGHLAHRSARSTGRPSSTAPVGSQMLGATIW